MIKTKGIPKQETWLTYKWDKNVYLFLTKNTPFLSQQITAFLNTMANSTKTTTVKTEFVDVVTEGELLSSLVSATFSMIVTEASLIETPPIDGQINKKTITTLYDKVFIDATLYWAFTENKLRCWENALEYKHFDTMYTNHQSLVNTIWKLRQQAQQLLEEADINRKRFYFMTRNQNPYIKNY